MPTLPSSWSQRKRELSWCVAGPAWPLAAVTGINASAQAEVIKATRAAADRAIVGALLLGGLAVNERGRARGAGESGVAIGIVLGLLYLFPIVANVVGNAHWHRHLEQIGPMTAGLAIQATTDLTSLPISPWAGLGVLAAWAATALLAGGLVLGLRDA